MSDYKKIRWVLLVVLGLNWAVAFAKLFIAYITRCQSMTADGFHSLSDGTSNVIGLIGITMSAKPVDADHPYGHKKYETFFSLGIAAILMLVAFDLIKASFIRLIHPVVPEVTVISFTVMIATICVNMLVAKFEYNKGRELSSDLLIADSMHTKADVFTSAAVIISLIGISLGFPIVDPIATFVIALFIGYAVFGIIKDASRILCDTVSAIDNAQISSIVLSVKGVRACHKIRTRGRPDDICIDLHVQVDPAMSVDDAHDVSYAVETAIKKDIPQATDVLVHIEPKEAHKR